MKKPLSIIFIIITAGLLFILCRKWNNPFDPANNHPPNRPRLVFPDSSAVSIDTSVVLRWTCSDPDSLDSLKYYIYLGTSSPPPVRDSGIVDTFYRPRNLNLLARYYWRIVAQDRCGETAASPIWSFTTIAQANNPPFTPSNPTPESGASGLFIRLTLSWTGGDPDTNDTVYYDIYLGTTSPPPLLISGHNQTSYTTARLEYDSTYYWQVVARDQHGTTTAGPLWQFKTCPAIRVLEPNDTTRWRVNSQQTILWTGGVDQRFIKKRSEYQLLSSSLGKTQQSLAADSVVIYYSTDSGANWLRHGIAIQSGSYTWNVPEPATPTARIEVRMFLSGDTATGTSTAYEIYDQNKPSPITITSPDSTSEWLIGSNYEITWTGGTLLGMDSSVLYYSTNNGTTWQKIGKITRPGDRFRWTVPSPPTNQARIRVTAFCLDSSTTGLSATFKIIEGLPPITITQPNAQTRWREGSVQTITWTGGPRTPDSVVVFYSTDDGNNWLRHGRATQPQSYNWRVPSPATEMARVQVRAYLDTLSTAGISARYVIYDSLPPSPITVTSPTAESRWLVGSIQQITWTGGTFAGMESTVIYYSTNGGVDWQRQGMTTQPGQFAWAVPSPPTNQARIAIRAWCGEHMTQGLSELFTVAQSSGPPDTVIATVTVGAKPRALLWDSIHNKIFVANYNDSSVTVIDGTSNQVITTIRVGRFPYNLCLNTNNGKVYVTNYGSNSVTIIDGASNEVVATVPVGTNPRAVCFNSNNNRVYVSNYRSASVTVIDGNNNQVITTVPVDTNPVALVYSPEYNKIYCANFARNNVTVIDGATNNVIGTVNAYLQPCTLIVDNRHNVAVANRASGTAGRITIINGANQNVITTITVGNEPYALAVNPTDSRLYCANSATNDLTVIDVNNYTVYTYINTGIHPRSVVWAGWVNKVYAANYDNGNVTMIDGASNYVEKTIPVGENPSAICTNTSDNKVYVANYNSNTVTIIGSNRLNFKKR